MPKLNLDLIVKEPLEVTLDGVEYIVEDPGVQKMLMFAKIGKQIKEGADMSVFVDAVASITPSIPKEKIQNLATSRLTQLILGIGEHFFGKVDPQGPLVK